MSGALVAQYDVAATFSSPLFWALVVGAGGLALRLANVAPRFRRLGLLLGAAGLVILAVAMPKLSSLEHVSQWVVQGVFWLFAGTAVFGSAAAITSRNPVYTAIWFAGSLLGVAGLFLFEHAQFLGVATLVVYAGAIIVTFLFVLMLANPEGQARYDWISWSKWVVPVAVAAGTGLVALVASSIPPSAAGRPYSPDENHVAQLGIELFARHLIAVEVAGTLLLVALVGAVAIVIQGKEWRAGSYRGTSGSGGRRP